MKDHPILFSGPMVRAILESGKAQTRRIVKPQPDVIHDAEPYWNVGGYRAWSFRGIANPLRMGTHNPLVCPYGKPGDLLWVRETWSDASGTNGHRLALHMATYRGHSGIVWRPSIHMPKWASRIWLEVTDVRVERLNEISGRDAAAEGFELPGWNSKYPDGLLPATELSMIDNFARYWRKLNDDKPGCGWDDSPWAWVISFKRTEKPMERAA